MGFKKIVWILTTIYPITLVLSILHINGLIEYFSSIYSIPLVFIILYFLNSLLEMGTNTTVKFLIVSITISYIFEFIGVHYGIPFGKYYYTEGLGPKILGVPIFIPLLWSSLGFYSLAATNSYLLASLAMVIIDLTFDPLLSQKVKLWIWQSPGQYFGVPITNFIGWFIVSAVFFYSFYILSKYKASQLKKTKPFSSIFYLEYNVSWGIIDIIKGLFVVGIVGIVLSILLIIIIASLN
ncbi:carotenoid biosynthesis protein [Caldisphaera sp.]|uniref:carotenoid biosynthesis protein n=1 Tax=Caldisphaera sp. TaxID=2060322 RepID=UPI0025C33878|nr:carotenoid biosynthesis protein [Caldisphaera sp.]